MNLVLQRVQAQVEAVRGQLPAGTTLDARLMSPALFPVVGYSLTSDRGPRSELRDFAEYRVLIFGVAMVLMMIWRPRGLIRIKRRSFDLEGLR